MAKGSDGSRWFAVQDPEGNKVEFVQPAANAKAPDNPNVIGNHIIHVGFLVHSREAEDKFYRDVLGFKPYWYGGMQDDKIDWVSQQVPDGHDWVEYMLTSGPSGTGIPANMTQQTLGVLDHLRLAKSQWKMRSKSCRRVTDWKAGTTRHRRSARTARGNSICTIRTGFARS